jgi:hypothetical protein
MGNAGRTLGRLFGPAADPNPVDDRCHACASPTKRTFFSRRMQRSTKSLPWPWRLRSLKVVASRMVSSRLSSMALPHAGLPIRRGSALVAAGNGGLHARSSAFPPNLDGIPPERSSSSIAPVPSRTPRTSRADPIRPKGTGPRPGDRACTRMGRLNGEGCHRHPCRPFGPEPASSGCSRKWRCARTESGC